MNLKSVCLLLSLFHASSAIALGLGELSVRSHLGQALHVTVKILGTNAATNADCFNLTPSAGAAAPPPARAKLSLERSGDDTLLHIRTPAAIEDPISQFSLTSDCESRLQRDYVILLDPPSQAMLAHNQNVPVVIPLKAPAKEEVKASSDAAPRPVAAQKTRRPTQTQPVRSVSRESPPQPRTQTAQTDSTPRLVLSGRHGLATGALSLRLDTSLPDLNRPRPANLTPDELSDENTSLTRKLAHLESQLRDLSQRNAKLERKRTSKLTAPVEGKTSQWPLYWLITAVLVGLAALFAWLLRRSRASTPDKKASWFNTASPAPDIDIMTADPWAQPTAGQEKSTPEPEPVAKVDPIIEFEPSATPQTTEVNDDILDQAEVYMAHGHGDLAIHLLQEHLRAAPDESPIPWLLLLDLLHREGDVERFTIAGNECRRYFNINLGSHPISQDSETGQGIEAYPHVLGQILKVWGSPEMDDFFEDLIFDRRGGTRIGFEPGAYREILLLRAVAQEM